MVYYYLFVCLFIMKTNVIFEHKEKVIFKVKDKKTKK